MQVLRLLETFTLGAISFDAADGLLYLSWDEARAKRGFVVIRILWQPLTKTRSLETYGEIGFASALFRLLPPGAILKESCSEGGANMAVKPIPDGYHSVTPILSVPGVGKLIDFLKQAFGATEKGRFMRPDGAIMHAVIKIGDSIVMMGEPMGDRQPMPSCIYLYVNDADSFYKRALQAGAISVSEPADQLYGDRGASVKDPSGNLWWIATRKEDVPPEELKRRSEALMKQGVAR
jgi:PhnB protein